MKHSKKVNVINITIYTSKKTHTCQKTCLQPLKKLEGCALNYLFSGSLLQTFQVGASGGVLEQRTQVPEVISGGRLEGHRLQGEAGLQIEEVLGHEAADGMVRRTQMHPARGQGQLHLQTTVHPQKEVGQQETRHEPHLGGVLPYQEVKSVQNMELHLTSHHRNERLTKITIINSLSIYFSHVIVKKALQYATN